MTPLVMALLFIVTPPFVSPLNSSSTISIQLLDLIPSLLIQGL